MGPLSDGRTLELLVLAAEGRPQTERTETMWVFDGEEWTQDDGGLGSTAKPETKRPRYEEMMPELQVVEVEIITPRPQTDRQIPPLPMP